MQEAQLRYPSGPLNAWRCSVLEAHVEGERCCLPVREEGSRNSDAPETCTAAPGTKGQRRDLNSGLWFRGQVWTCGTLVPSIPSCCITGVGPAGPDLGNGFRGLERGDAKLSAPVFALCPQLRAGADGPAVAHRFRAGSACAQVCVHMCTCVPERAEQSWDAACSRRPEGFVEVSWPRVLLRCCEAPTKPFRP